MITFCVVQNDTQIYNLVRMFNVLTDFVTNLAYCLPFVRISLITKHYHYLNYCYNKTSLLT
jgi:hypothetical protein